MGILVHRLADVDAFLRSAEPFLAAREAEHNLIFGVCTAIASTPEAFGEGPPRFVTLTDSAGKLVGASLRTPPYNQVLSEMDDPVAVDALADELHEEDLPGVTGPKEHAAHFAERWTALTGAPARLAVEERIFQLDRVVPPRRRPPGAWRMAASSDRQLVADWLVAFVLEATPEEPPPRPLETADRWIAGRYRSLYLWEDGGRAVSLVGAGGQTPNGVRIGPVYTPPHERGHGYARALTAAASQDQLDRGRRFCFLFTDLANPTSNRIYQEIGYRPVRDVDLYRFGSSPS